MKKYFFLLTLLPFFIFSQEIKPGDKLKEILNVLDVKGNKIALKIPEPAYVIFYRYSWKNIGKGVETIDSVKLLEQKIATMLEAGELNKLKIICLSYDLKKDLGAWQEHISKNPPFKPTTLYTVEYYNVNSDSLTMTKCIKLLSKLTVIGDDGTLYVWASQIAKFNFSLFGANGFKGTTIHAKLISDIKGVKTPLENTKVALSAKNNKHDTLRKTKTDQYGDFEMHVPGNINDYSIRVTPNDKSIDNVSIVTQSGQEIAAMVKTEEDFQWHLLKAEVIKLAEMRVEDVAMKYERYKAQNKKEFTIDENIFYELGKSHVDARSKPVLDKVTKILTDEPGVQLMIISHTDTQGDDKSNLLLSQKRAGDVADYLIINGISAKRIKMQGKGETEIRNRCANGVKCSDKEHEYNRRTEFKFIRP